MISFIIICILLVIAIGIFAKHHVYVTSTDTDQYGRRQEKEEPRKVKIWYWGLIPLSIALVWSIFAFTIAVPAKNVGVITTFGKVSDRNLDSGLHLKWPWQKVTTLDATIITDKFVGSQNGESGRDDLDCISVRIQDGTTACVSMVIRSQIDPDKANDLYANYRSDNVDETIFDALIRTQLTASANEVFRDFDPVLSGRGVDVTSSAPNLQALSDDVLEVMEHNLADASTDGQPEVNMVSLTISFIAFSQTTEERINDLQAEVAKTRVAQQQEATAAAQAKANKVLSDSVSNDPNVLVSKCLDIMTAMVQANQPIPAGFTCWPGGGNGALVYGNTTGSSSGNGNK